MKEKNTPKFSLSSKIFIGFGLAIAAGLFFGDMVGWLKVVGDIYIDLLQMTVLPYVILSLILGLGSLDYRQALLLARKGGLLLLLIWAITLVVAFLFPLAFPDWKSASFFTKAMVQSKEPVDFIKLYIPANPFHSLANNLVPAVVIFSMAIGLALIGIKDKSRVMADMHVLLEALTKVTNFVVRLTPVGVFAITASAVGTMALGDFKRMAVYLVTYVAFSTVMSFWILPGLVTTLTPLKYRQVLGLTKDALITAFATSSLFIVLPILAEKSKELVGTDAVNREEAESAVDVIIPASFNFPHAGKIFTFSFILFAGWFSGYKVELSDYPTLIGSGFVSLFANVNVAVPFMLDIMHIPSDTFQFFVATSVINTRFGTLLAAVHVLALTILTASSMSGQLKVQWPSLIRYSLISCLLLVVVIVGSRLFLSVVISDSYDKDVIIKSMQAPDHDVEKRMMGSRLPVQESPPVKGMRYRTIEERRELRICYDSDNIPFSYLNAGGELVGFDIELLEIFGAELDVKLVYIPLEDNDEHLTDFFAKGYCDIGTGRSLTPDLALKQNFSIPYIDYTLAFLVKDYKRHDFNSLQKLVQNQHRLTIATMAGPYYRRLLHDRLPHAKILPIESMEAFVKDSDEKADALLTVAEKAAAWSVLYPQYTITTPFADTTKIPSAFPVPQNEEELADVLKVWISLKTKDGTVSRLYDYWIQDQLPPETSEHRWSIIRNVLHWVK